MVYLGYQLNDKIYLNIKNTNKGIPNVYKNIPIVDPGLPVTNDKINPIIINIKTNNVIPEAYLFIFII
jgi:hypothetical protein